MKKKHSSPIANTADNRQCDHLKPFASIQIPHEYYFSYEIISIDLL